MTVYSLSYSEMVHKGGRWANKKKKSEEKPHEQRRKTPFSRLRGGESYTNAPEERDTAAASLALALTLGLLYRVSAAAAPLSRAPHVRGIESLYSRGGALYYWPRCATGSIGKICSGITAQLLAALPTCRACARAHGYGASRGGDNARGLDFEDGVRLFEGVGRFGSKRSLLDVLGKRFLESSRGPGKHFD